MYLINILINFLAYIILIILNNFNFIILNIHNYCFNFVLDQKHIASLKSSISLIKFFLFQRNLIEKIT